MSLQHLQAFAAQMKGNHTPAEKLARAAHMVRAMKRSATKEAPAMPYASKAQVGFMHANHPQIAARWDKQYGVPKVLPEHVSGKGKGKADAAKRALAAAMSRKGPPPKDAKIPPDVQRLIDAEQALEAKGGPKTDAERKLEAEISQRLGRPYTGKR